MPRPSKHLPREPDGSTKKSRLLFRLKRLRKQRDIISREIKKLEKLAGGLRQFNKCLRCGYEWRGLKETVPKNCARCHSASWNRKEVKDKRARKPGDPAAPGWERNAAKRRPPVNKSLTTVNVPLTTPEPQFVHKPIPGREAMPDLIPVDVEAIGRASEEATREMLTRALHTPEGLPAPPVIGMDPGFVPTAVVMLPPAFRAMPDPPTQAPPAPVLYIPRPPRDEPQPESTYVPPPPTDSPVGHATVTRAGEGSGIGSTEPDPSDNLEAMFPPLAIDVRIAGDRGEEAWENHVEET